MGLINNTATYPPRTPNSKDDILGIKRDENGKTVTFPIESIASLVLASLIGSAFISDSFTYNGSNNVFTLSETAYKVTMVYIENGAFPSEVPIGNVTTVTVDDSLLLTGNVVVIQYIKLE